MSSDPSGRLPQGLCWEERIRWARLVPAGSEGGVPEHFYAEVLGVLTRRFLIEAKLT